MSQVDIGREFQAAREAQRRGDLAAAELGYRRILALDSRLAEVHYNLGLVLRALGHLPDAALAYARALELQPDLAPAANNLGAALEHLGRRDEAEAMFRQALVLQPDSPEAWGNLGGVLKDLGRVPEALVCQERAVELAPDDPRLLSNLIFTQQYQLADDPAALRRVARRWHERHTRPPVTAGGPHRNSAEPGRRLRIGYVSPYFRTHCQAHFTVPLFAAHDHRAFEVFAYSDVTAPDALTARLRAGTDAWRDTAGLDNAQLADLIRRDGIDVLVDLTLHMAQDRLAVFARKPAPVQVTWLGYPGTTGLEAIDIRFTDPQLDPPGEADAFYAERSVRLADTFWCYDPLTDKPAVNALPAAKAGTVTFGCLNNFCKVNDATLALWTRVLAAVPESRLLLMVPSGTARERVASSLGVAPSRLEFADYRPRAEYLELYRRIDVGLDTFPYNGHTTSLDALWMGVPVVTLYGRSAVSRAGLSLLTNLGLSGLAAETPEGFVCCAAELAGDRERLAGLRATLRGRMERSPLMDAPRFTRQLELACRNEWRAWCTNVASRRPA